MTKIISLALLFASTFAFADDQQAIRKFAFEDNIKCLQRARSDEQRDICMDSYNKLIASLDAARDREEASELPPPPMEDNRMIICQNLGGGMGMCY